MYVFNLFLDIFTFRVFVIASPLPYDTFRPLNQTLPTELMPIRYKSRN